MMATVSGQNAYYDAKELKTYLEGGKFPIATTTDARREKVAKYFEIINKYSGNAFKDLKSMHDKIGLVPDDDQPNPDYNPFLAGFMSPGGVQSFSMASFGSSSSIRSSIGSFPVTKFADGLAKFLVKRGKEELYVSFFQHFPEFSMKYPEFKIMFPSTSQVIENFKSWEYANVINTLREALDKDLKAILTNLPKVFSYQCTNDTCSEEAKIRIASYKKFISSEFGIGLATSMLIVSEVISENKLPEIISNVASPENVKKIELADKVKEQNIKSALNFIRIISDALRSNDVTRSYITADELKELLEGDAVLRKLFFGLLYQQLEAQKVRINGKQALVKPETVGGFITYVSNFMKAATPVNTAVQKLKEDKKIKDADIEEDWANIFQGINDLIPVLINVEVIDSNLRLPPLVQEIAQKSQLITGIAHDIAVKNYSAAIVGLLNKLTIPGNSTPVAAQPEANTPTAGVAAPPENKEQRKARKASERALKEAKEKEVALEKGMKDFKMFFVKYGSFAANVVQAKNSDEVEKAIESLVLPVGSATIKRETNCNIALNAYLGAFAGYEYMPSLAYSKNAFTTGITAPVGVSVSWGNIKCDPKRGGKSFTIFVPVIDIGALAAYRLEDSKTEISSDIELKNIIAPGLYFYWGFGRCPISLGAGAQVGPQLRNINKGVPQVPNGDKLYIRYGINLVVDIPLLNFYTKSNQ